MKKLLLALAVAASAQISAFAQTYTFTQTTGTYTNLASPTVLTTLGWDDESFDLAIGFPFTIGNITTDSVSLDTYGDLFFPSPTNPIGNAIIAYESDMVDLEISSNPSQVGYQLSGTAGSRILKIEFRNAGFYGQSGPVANEFTNFQVWLHEGSNIIEMHYGPNTITAAGMASFMSSGSSHGVVTDIDLTTGDITGQFLTGAPANPTFAGSVIPFNPSIQYWIWPALTNSVPANGTIYRFSTGATTGIAKTFDKANVSVFPNPVVNTLNIKGLSTKGNVTITVTDILGKVVLSEKAAAAQNVSVNVSNLKKGVYSVEISSEEGRSIKQIVKQ